MSVSEALKAHKPSVYSQLTEQMIHTFMSELHKPYEEKRELVIMTGSAGKDMIDEAIQKQNDKDFSDFLASKNHISEDEKIRIHQMIESTPDDYEVAKAILTSLSEKHFSYYHTTKRLK